MRCAILRYAKVLYSSMHGTILCHTAFRLVAVCEREGRQVATKHRPTLRSQWLGQRLRELREQNRKTLREIAEYLQRDPSSVSRMEAGIHPARIPDVLAYLDFCGVSDDEQRQALVQLAKESRQSGWWDRYVDEHESLVDRIWLESHALQIDSFAAMVIPGHLQLRAYAEATVRATDFETDSQIERLVDLRMQRQKRIQAQESLMVNVVLDEAVLHRRTGGNAVMRSQLLHLAELAGSGQMRIAVLPFEVPAHSSLDGSFDIMRLEAPYPTVGYVSTPAGAIFLEGDDVAQLEKRFERLSESALSPGRSATKIKKLAIQFAE